MTRVKAKRVKYLVKDVQAKEDLSESESNMRIYVWDSQRLSQGSKSVDDYHREMEMTMIRASILEDQEAITA
ncbi:hypothetical protein CR513_24309, partial [Mucuna pruriens]